MANDDEPKLDKGFCDFGNKLTVDNIRTDVIDESAVSSESDDEMRVELAQAETLKKLTDVPPLDVSRNPTAIGSIAITDSENVHFGNKTYFNGPVTIKQYIKHKTGIENGSYVKSEEETVTEKESPPPNWNELYLVEVYYYMQHIVFVTLFGVLLLSNLYLLLTNDGVEHVGGNYKTSAVHNFEEPLQIVAPEDVLRIVSRSDWLAQPEEGPLDIIQHPIPWVIIAHTATENCDTQSKCVLRVRLIQSFHIESRGWNDIGYNFLVGGDGSVYVGRGWDYIGAHTKGYNVKSICIAFIGTFNNEPPPRQQVDACLKLVKLGVSLGKLSRDYKILAHRQLIPSLSPGDEIFELMKSWPHFASNFSSISELYNG